MAVIKSGNSYDHLAINLSGSFGALRALKVNGLGRIIAHQSASTFLVSATITPVGSATDIIRIVGSASKVVRVYSIWVGTTSSAAGSIEYTLIKRNSDNTDGTFTTPGVVPLDGDDSMSTAIVGHYVTANPVSLGNQLGKINIVRRAVSLGAPGNMASIVRESGREMLPWVFNCVLDKFITLRGISQLLVVSAGGVTVANQNMSYRVVWTESDI